MPDHAASRPPAPRRPAPPLGPVQRVVAGLGTLFGLGVAALLAEARIGIGMGPATEDAISTAVVAIGAALVVSGFFLGENPDEEEAAVPPKDAHTDPQPPGPPVGGEPAAASPSVPAPAAVAEAVAPIPGRNGDPAAAPSRAADTVPQWIAIALAVVAALGLASVFFAGSLVSADMAALLASGAARPGAATSTALAETALIAGAITRVGLAAALAAVAVALLLAWRAPQRSDP